MIKKFKQCLKYVDTTCTDEPVYKERYTKLKKFNELNMVSTPDCNVQKPENYFNKKEQVDQNSTNIISEKINTIQTNDFSILFLA